MCIISSLYVSGFSSDTRCRDLKIKSQSVCHLLTPLSLPPPPCHPTTTSSCSPVLPHHLSGHLSGNDLCPIGCLQSPINCRVYCVVCAIAEFSDQDARKKYKTYVDTCAHTCVCIYFAVCGKLPQNAKCDLESFNRKWQCYRCAAHQTKGKPQGT